MTPPSSPSEPVNINPEAVCIPPNPAPVTFSNPEPQAVVPRRSTRVRIPTKRCNPAELEYDLVYQIATKGIPLLNTADRKTNL